MKHVMSCLTAVIVLTASVTWAQSGQRDPFDGTWRLNVARSTATWQAHPQPKVVTPQPQSFELVTMKVTNDTMEYSAEYARGNEQHKKASYTAKYNDAKWQDLRGAADAAFSSLTLVKGTDRILYWVTRGKDGQFAGVILHKMAEDGKAFVTVGLGSDGYVQYVRVFEKQ